ncbi:DUF3365 domain-containing protein [Pelagicoccus sp. NFK12]|uniref:DUF3365 domain-containing protein n=1 Tax=Pelagicoccus enzymogenes TaxID=2773457 RepID=A0A927F831_9BACT|nr:DUF3365 domain-containing protein [Pelagicoccus enzymogenes]MBD5779599.1 DUF3365 domain-containing protein [Pelagicoccus enzymogenes]
MKKKNILYAVLLSGATLTSTLFLSGCGESEAATGGISPQKMADGLHLVMKSDRTIYTRNVVNRLVKQDKVIKASEHWADDKALPLPAQMFRMGAEMVAKEPDAGFSYSLQSIWPINAQNAPKTEVEKTGLQYVVDNPGQNYYAEEELGGVKYFTGVYADTGVAAACVDCHNEHKDSPKTDFKLGDVMGGVVIRIPLD